MISMPVFKFFNYCFGGVMFSVLESSADGRGFNTWPGQNKGINIGICNISAYVQHLGISAKTARLRVRKYLGKLYVSIYIHSQSDNCEIGKCKFTFL